ncbi:MAG TPA: 50S ribosomal protein L9 [Pyrinomonadaceae bacterium]|jgi:large subunit ribosomal protein L9|nr:50S ribosomal protein L9 [Pyrinomonadaceae bacterium]
MSTTTVLLREDVDNLGGRGEIVKVKAGYARNFLLPRSMATLATKGNIKQIENEKAALLKKASAEKATAELQADQLKDLSLSFERKAGEEGALFGSVTSMDIAEAIQAKGYEIDRRKLVMKDAIKHTGDYTVGWKLHREVVVQIPVTVTAEGGEVPSAEAPKAEAKEKKAEKPAEAPAAETVAETAAESVAAAPEAEEKSE